MSRLQPASDVAVVEDEDTIYVARLPDGPIVVLAGIAGLIWIEACAGERETVAVRVAAVIDPPHSRISSEVDEFVTSLVDRGLLRVPPA